MDKIHTSVKIVTYTYKGHVLYFLNKCNPFLINNIYNTIKYKLIKIIRTDISKFYTIYIELFKTKNNNILYVIIYNKIFFKNVKLNYK